MKVIRAEVLGMCFGVRAALKTMETLERPAGVTIHGDLVHNEVILDRLRSRGFHMTAETNRMSLPLTNEVLITAHGISQRERRRLEDGGKTLIDTTCPLVLRAHDAAQQLQLEGRFVLVIGKRDHVEVRGIIEDLTHYEVIQSPEQVRRYPFSRIGVMCQTTMPAALVETIRDAIAHRNPEAEIRFIDTVCHPTKDHQHALDQLLTQVPAVVVVGGKHSNNTRAMVERCRTRGVPAYHVQSAADLQPDWFTGLDHIGLTAGTSTLDETIAEVHDALLHMNQN